jgi:hypothetical protein
MTNMNKPEIEGIKVEKSIWRRPTVTTISIAETMAGDGSVFDGIASSPASAA